MATVTLQVPAVRIARWYFDGYETPALDVTRDPMPPSVRGYLAVPTTEYISASGTRVGVDAEQVEEYYRVQGLRASDLLKMSARDAIQRTPVAEIRARTSPPPLDPLDAETRKRGTVMPVTATRTLDNTVVPNEPAPLP